MSGPCSVKSSNEAWNAGVEAFEKAMLLNGGDVTAAIRFALGEIKEKFPDKDFDPSSFATPIVESLKAAELIDPDYTFKDKPVGKTQAEKKEKGEKHIESLKAAHQKKIDTITKKLDGLDEKQQKEVASKLFDKLYEKGMLTESEVKNIYAKSLGLPAMTPELESVIDEAATNMQAVDSIDAEIEAKIAEINAIEELTPEQNKQYSKDLNELNKRRTEAVNNSIKSNQAMASLLQEVDPWYYQIPGMIRMNLMNISSLLKNATGGIADVGFRMISNTANSVLTNLLVRPLTKINSSPVGAKAQGGVKGIPEMLGRVKANFLLGNDPKHHTKQLQRPSYLDSMQAFKRAASTHGPKSLMTYAGAVLKMTPDFVSRVLGSTDTIFNATAEYSELNRIGQSKGLTGAKLEAFLMKPDEESEKIAKKYADKATYKQDVGFFEKLTVSPKKMEEYLIGKGWNPIMAKVAAAFAGLSSAVVTPFVKTPLNLLRQASRIVLPEARIVKGVYDYSRATTAQEKQNALTSALSEATVGFYIRYIALQMVMNGLMTPGYNDDDERVKEIREKTKGGQGKININAFLRGLFTADVSAKEGDVMIDLSSLGAMGIALGAYAHAYSKYDKKTIQDQMSYTNELKNAGTLALAELSSALDNTFFSGINQIMQIAQDKEGSKIDRYGANLMATLITTMYPGIVQQASKAKVPEVKKSYDTDKSWAENLAIILDSRFLFGGEDAANKTYLLAKNGSDVRKKKGDSYIGRLLRSMDPLKANEDVLIDNPDTRMAEAMAEVPEKEREKLMPGFIKDVVDGKKLTKEQHDYLKNQAAIYRVMYSNGFIMSEDFKSTPFESKVDVLKRYYEDARKKAVEDLKVKYPELEEVNTESEEQAVDEAAIYNKYKNED